MLEAHQKLVEEYKANEKAIDRSTAGVIILGLFITGIVIGMQSIQTTASIQLNILATSAVLLLLTWHFLGFYRRRSLYEKSANVILKGVQIEQENPFIELSFFKDCLKKFETLGQILKMAVFDLFLMCFFSVSFTQLIKSISPEVLPRIRGLGRLWRSVKYKEIYPKGYENLKEVKQGLKKYFEFYNENRPHQWLGYRTQAEVYFGK